MFETFADEESQDIWNGMKTKRSRRRLPEPLWPVAQRKLDMLHRVSRLEELRIPPPNHLERLVGNRLGQWSIRINDKYRVCFRHEAEKFFDVEIVDYHL